MAATSKDLNQLKYEVLTTFSIPKLTSSMQTQNLAQIFKGLSAGVQAIDFSSCNFSDLCRSDKSRKRVITNLVKAFRNMPATVTHLDLRTLDTTLHEEMDMPLFYDQYQEDLLSAIPGNITNLNLKSSLAIEIEKELAKAVKTNICGLKVLRAPISLNCFIANLRKNGDGSLKTNLETLEVFNIDSVANLAEFLKANPQLKSLQTFVIGNSRLLHEVLKGNYTLTEFTSTGENYHEEQIKELMLRNIKQQQQIDKPNGPASFDELINVIISCKNQNMSADDTLKRYAPYYLDYKENKLKAIIDIIYALPAGTNLEQAKQVLQIACSEPTISPDRRPRQ